MSVYKDSKTNKWYAKVSYKDAAGKRRNTTKRGFSTKKEALEWERGYLLKKEGSMNMMFKDYAEQYLEDLKNTDKYSTMLAKESVIRTHLIPFFGEMGVSEITTADILSFQKATKENGKEKSGEKFSESYCKTIHVHLSAMLNHAVKYYGLKENVARKAGSMGSHKGRKDINFWTLDEYKKVRACLMLKPPVYIIVEILYWCGLRIGECLALTLEDIDFENRKIKINKTYSKVKGKEVITTPKTETSIRDVVMPDFICIELQDYINSLQNPETGRLFHYERESVRAALNKSATVAGVKIIRVHDLRHSHASLLINMGYGPVEVAARLGHNALDVSLRYMHMFPSVQTDMADKLDKLEG